MEYLGLCGNYSSITIFRENGVWCKDNGHKRTNDHDQCAEPNTAGRLVQTHLLAYLNLLPAHFGQLLVLGSVLLLQYLATCPVHAGILSGSCSTALVLSKGMVERTVLPRI
jgi:hypothetical protein